MLFQKKVKAGTLLYALLMLSIFTLLLQFYLERQATTIQAVKVSQKETTAYLMAKWTQEEFTTPQAKKEVKTQTLHFTEGDATYSEDKTQVQVLVQLDSGERYSYHFPLSGQK